MTKRKKKARKKGSDDRRILENYPTNFTNNASVKSAFNQQLRRNGSLMYVCICIFLQYWLFWRTTTSSLGGFLGGLLGSHDLGIPIKKSNGVDHKVSAIVVDTMIQTINKEGRALLHTIQRAWCARLRRSSCPCSAGLASFGPFHGPCHADFHLDEMRDNERVESEYRVMIPRTFSCS